MDDSIVWVKISDEAESWHIVEHSFVSRANVPLTTTFCGRVSSEVPAIERPGHEKTCESCLRIRVSD